MWGALLNLVNNNNCVVFYCIWLCFVGVHTMEGSNPYQFPYWTEINDGDLHKNKLLCAVFGICKPQRPRAIQQVFEWGILEYDYPTLAARQSAIDSGEFVPTSNAPIDIDIYYDGQGREKVFVTIPRFNEGVPVTLGTVMSRAYNGNPIIAPYPSWRWHQNSLSCGRDRIVSVFHIKIDECGRLWVVDSGHIYGYKSGCSPQILAFDLATNSLLVRYEIPDNQLETTSLLVTPIVDVRGPGCRDTFVYVADSQAWALIVYDVRRNTSWKIVDKTFYPYPSFGTYSLLGYHFELMDGILGLELSPYIPGEDRVLFYHAMSSGKENWAYTSYLRNQSVFLDNPTPAPEIFHTFPGSRRSQKATHAIDKQGIMYFGLISDTSLYCWNTGTQYDERNFGLLEYDIETLQFLVGIKVINNPNGFQELWFMTNKYQRVTTNTLDPSETNFRIQRAKLSDLMTRSKCNYPRRSDQNHPDGYGDRPSNAYESMPSESYNVGCEHTTEEDKHDTAFYVPFK